jgi:hypothetical protein
MVMVVLHPSHLQRLDVVKLGVTGYRQKRPRAWVAIDDYRNFFVARIMLVVLAVFVFVIVAAVATAAVHCPIKI